MKLNVEVFMATFFGHHVLQTLHFFAGISWNCICNNAKCKCKYNASKPLCLSFLLLVRVCVCVCVSVGGGGEG